MPGIALSDWGNGLATAGYQLKAGTVALSASAVVLPCGYMVVQHGYGFPRREHWVGGFSAACLLPAGFGAFLL